MENPWKIGPWKIHGKSNGKTLEKSMGNPWKIHGKSMDNKNGNKEMFPWYSMGPHGGPWGPMGPHEESWVPMGSHGFPWVSMGSHGSHGFPWVPMGSHPWVPMGSPWVQFFGFSSLDLTGTKWTPPYHGTKTGKATLHDTKRQPQEDTKRHQSDTTRH